MTAAETRLLAGSTILREAYADLARYRGEVTSSRLRVGILRFAARPSDSPLWRSRMEASRISAEQKARAFGHLGFGVDHDVLPRIGPAEFAELIAKRNADPSIAALIVQHPTPPHLTAIVQYLDPQKDLDGLLGERSVQPCCATAEAITRVVHPFAGDAGPIAVVGADGFVGGGVVAMLRRAGAQVDEYDAGDDLRGLRSADIVVSATGVPRLLTSDHIRPQHRLVVDSGFTPLADGSVSGDVHPAAAAVPRYLTPVPGGMGPVEMVVLMRRAIRQRFDPDLPPWQCQTDRFIAKSALGSLGGLAVPGTALPRPQGWAHTGSPSARMRTVTARDFDLCR